MDADDVVEKNNSTNISIYTVAETNRGMNVAFLLCVVWWQSQKPESSEARERSFVSGPRVDGRLSTSRSLFASILKMFIYTHQLCLGILHTYIEWWVNYKIL